MGKQLFGKMTIIASLFLWEASQSYAQQDSIYFKDSVFVLYSNGIFKTHYINYPFHTQTSGIWTIVQDGLIRLKSFDEYKCEILNVVAYYDSTLSKPEFEVYGTNGKLLIRISLDGDPEITPAPYCDCYIADTSQYNHFVFVISRSKWNYEDIYIDELFRKTPDGLKWVRRKE